MSKLDLYITKHGKSLRCGYTTGSCAAAAAKASVIMFERKRSLDYVEIDTPAGIRLKLEVHNPIITEEFASCSIVKDAGDDPDNTDGIEIYAKISRRKDKNIVIDGGDGIGRINRKGLFGEVGQAAINPVPKEMIEKEIKGISENGYDVLIYAPEGETMGKKTFNSQIGIEGGISIVGTKGIVYPMSEDALLKTIYMEVDMIRDIYGHENIILVPGNYGEKISESLSLNKSRVKVSNYLGESLLYVYNKGFESITLIGHIGKFSKLSIGIFNTHSNISDTRMEAFIYYLAMMGAPITVLRRINNAITAEEALNMVIEEGYGDMVRQMEIGAEYRIKKYLKDNDIKVKVIIYSMERGVDIC